MYFFVLQIGLSILVRKAETHTQTFARWQTRGAWVCACVCGCKHAHPNLTLSSFPPPHITPSPSINPLIHHPAAHQVTKGGEGDPRAVPGLAGEGDTSCRRPVLRDSTAALQPSPATRQDGSIPSPPDARHRPGQGSGGIRELRTDQIHTHPHRNVRIPVPKPANQLLECEHWPSFPSCQLLSKKGQGKAQLPSEALAHLLFGLYLYTAVFAAQGSCSFFYLQYIPLLADHLLRPCASLRIAGCHSFPSHSPV